MLIGLVVRPRGLSNGRPEYIKWIRLLINTSGSPLQGNSKKISLLVYFFQRHHCRDVACNVSTIITDDSDNRKLIGLVARPRGLSNGRPEYIKWIRLLINTSGSPLQGNQRGILRQLPNRHPSLPNPAL